MTIDGLLRMKCLKSLFGIKTKAEKEMQKNEWNELKEKLKVKVSNFTQPAVHLVKTDDKTKSKFGGSPVVDGQDFIWPESNGRPMSFLAQFDLKKISEQVKYEWLGNSGSVLFFYDIEEMPWGFDPKDRNKWKVIFQENPSVKINFPKELSEEGIIKESYIEERKVEILPDYDDENIRNLNLTDEELDLYFELDEHFQEFGHSGLPMHQVGGFPSPVQENYMELEAQLASTGTYMGDGKAYQTKEAKAFLSKPNDWRLLFQFDSDDYLGVMWGDVGMLYFWVQQDLSKVNSFDNTWLILQCA